MSAPQLASWGNFPHRPQLPLDCHWRGELPALLDRMSSITTLPFGNGRSYGDVCLADSGKVLCTRRLDRFIAADWERGLIRVESGVTLGSILQQAIPRGWFLPVVPGTRQVSVGGAIANDVHGKNHHRAGTFGRHIRQLELVRSDSGALGCSAQQNSDLFTASIGGLGLTGVVSWAEIQLVPLTSSRIDCINIKFADLGEFFRLSEELDQKFEYTAAWLDCQSSGGRGVYTAGNHATDSVLQVDDTRTASVPASLPLSAINRVTLPVLNTLWYRLSREQSRRQSYGSFLFPLDGIAHWNRLYGRRGFQQFQCVIPQTHAEAALPEICARIAASGSGSFLSVLKKCGDLSSPGLLSFPLEGTSLALDFPHNAALGELLSDLDALVREAGGRLYPAKDAHMPAADFQLAYPSWEILERLRDPGLMSLFWRRVTQGD